MLASYRNTQMHQQIRQKQLQQANAYQECHGPVSSTNLHRSLRSLIILAKSTSPLFQALLKRNLQLHSCLLHVLPPSWPLGQAFNNA